jgi:hypothetical protein
LGIIKKIKKVVIIQEVVITGPRKTAKDLQCKSRYFFGSMTPAAYAE